MANVILKDRYDKSNTYRGVEMVSLTSEDGELVTFYSQKKVDDAVESALENAPKPALYKKTFYANGTYTPESPFIGFNEIVINVPTSGGGTGGGTEGDGGDDGEDGGEETQPDASTYQAEFEMQMRVGEYFFVSPLSDFTITASDEEKVSINPSDLDNHYLMVAQEIGKTELTIRTANGNIYATINVDVKTDNFIALPWAEEMSV